MTYDTQSHECISGLQKPTGLLTDGMEAHVRY